MSLSLLSSRGGGDDLDMDSMAESEIYTKDEDTDNVSSDDEIQRKATTTANRRYSIAELVNTLGNPEHSRTINSHSAAAGANNTHTNPELERRVLDFALAQQKRRDKYGAQKPWGIYGMYEHLAHVRIDLEWAEDAAWRRQHGEPYLAWADFDKARLRGMNRPWFTYGVILVCSIMLLVEFAVNDWKIEPMNVNPMVGPSKDTLITVGARDTNLIVAEGEWYRLISPLILHAGIIHYGINMLALWFIGGAIEQSHGVVNTVVLFLVPGIGGNILSAIFLPQYISVGASGGIFGLMGGCIADIGLNWSLLFIKDGDETESQVWRRNFFAVFFLFFEFVINIILGLVTPFIDNWSHLGGILYGACCAFSTIEPLAVGFFGVNSTTWGKIRALAVKFCGLIVSVVLIIVTTAWLATSTPGDIPCNKCRYVSCVPFPFFTADKWWYCDDCDFVTANLFKNGTTTYQQIELTCPDKTVAMVDISAEMLSNSNDVGKQLPTYCRDYCDSVFK